MNFALNYYRSAEQAEKYTIKPYRFPEFCTMFLVIPLALMPSLSYIESLLNGNSQYTLSGGLAFSLGGLLFIGLIFRSLSIIFWGAGTISIYENGFTVQSIFNNQHFISWKDNPKFFLTYAGFRSFHEVVTMNTKKLSRYQIHFMGYPISNLDLRDYLSHTAQLIQDSKPLEDYSRYRKMSNWRTFSTITNICFGFFLWLGLLEKLF